MSEDIDSLMNYCSDLVALKESEAFPRTLLSDHQAGEWVAVEKLCRGIGITPPGAKSDLMTAWLPDPHGGNLYVIIIFYDDETKESLAAQYNKGRLLGMEK